MFIDWAKITFHIRTNRFRIAFGSASCAFTVDNTLAAALTLVTPFMVRILKFCKTYTASYIRFIASRTSINIFALAVAVGVVGFAAVFFALVAAAVARFGICIVG